MADKWRPCKGVAVSQAFIFYFKWYSLLHFAVCQLLCWAFLFYIYISEQKSEICPRNVLTSVECRFYDNFDCWREIYSIDVSLSPYCHHLVTILSSFVAISSPLITILSPSRHPLSPLLLSPSCRRLVTILSPSWHPLFPCLSQWSGRQAGSSLTDCTSPTNINSMLATNCCRFIFTS